MFEVEVEIYCIPHDVKWFALYMMKTVNLYEEHNDMSNSENCQLYHSSHPTNLALIQFNFRCVVNLVLLSFLARSAFILTNFYETNF